MDPIAHLLAVEQLKLLKAHYFRFVDSKDWHALSALLADDAAFDRSYGAALPDPAGGWLVPPLDPPDVVRGRAAIVRMVRAAVEPLRTVHQGHSPEIEIVDDGSAKGIWAMTDELRDREGRLILAGSGHYHETYERTASGWVFKTVRLTRLSILRGDGRHD